MWKNALHSFNLKNAKGERGQLSGLPPPITASPDKMGCTSSAPNMSDLQQHSHTTENEKKESSDDKHDDDNLKNMDTNENKESEQDESTNVECNEIKMLPTCDTLDENLQLDRKCNSPPDIVTNEQERETADINDTEVNVTMETEQEIPSVELEEEPHKCTTFEEVVDQVVLETILNDIANMPGVIENVSQNDDETTEENVNQDSPIETKNATNGDDLEGINNDEDNLGETASPSQSECSRATRWEALADIAAELPPSLAVDPVTGQIYSLTK